MGTSTWIMKSVQDTTHSNNSPTEQRMEMCHPELIELESESEMNSNPLLLGFTAEEDEWERPPSSLSDHGSDAGPRAKVFTRRKAGQNSAGRMPGKDPLVIDYDTLIPFFKVSQRQACQELGIGLSTMKRLCRKFGIKRWPASSAQAAREAEEITAQRSPSVAISEDNEPAGRDLTGLSLHNTLLDDDSLVFPGTCQKAPCSDGLGDWSEDEPCMSRSFKLNRELSGFKVEDVITKLDVGFDDESPLMEGTPNKFSTPVRGSPNRSPPQNTEWSTNWLSANLNHFTP